MMICSKFVLLFLVAIRYKFYSVSPEEVWIKIAKVEQKT
jgi:hypothetical protein